MCLSLALWLTPAASAQGQAEGSTSAADGPVREGFGDEVDIYVVNVDVHVRDRDGAPVPGLTADDFELYVDGERVRDLSYFHAEERPLTAAPAQSASSRQPGVDAVAGDTVDGDAGGVDASDVVTGGNGQGSFGEVRSVSVMTPAPRAIVPGGGLSRVVVLVDNINTSPPHRNRVLQELREYLAQQPGTVEVMFATYDGAVNILQPFSSDPLTLEAALDTISRLPTRGFERDGQRRSILSSVSNAVTALNESSSGRGGGAAEFARSEINSAVRQIEIFAESSYRDTLFVVQGLSAFVQSMAGLQGRKSLIYVSDGLPMRPGSGLADLLQDASRDGNNVFEGLQGDGGGGAAGQGPDGQQTFPTLGGGGGDRDPLQQELLSLRSTLAQYDIGSFLQRLTALANTHRVTFYTINGAAGDATMLGADSSFGFDAPVGNALAMDQQNLRETLRFLAETTGGVALTSGTDVGGLLTKVATDLGSYYALGFLPPAGADGEYHEIEVRFAQRRRNLDLRHREGYVAARRAPGQVATAVSVLTLGMEDNPLDIDLTVLGEEPAPEPGQHVVQLDLSIPIAHLVLVPETDGSYRADLRIYLATMSEDGQISPVRSLPLSFPVPADRLDEARTQSYAARLPLPLEDGPRRLALGVEDVQGGRTAFVLEDILVGGSGQGATASGDR